MTSPRHGHVFETVGKARALRDELHKRLGLDPRELDGRDCPIDGEACGRPSCPVCARSHRLWLYMARLGLRQTSSTACYVTIYLGSVRRGSLRRADIARAHHALRQRLRRRGFTGILVGGTEVAFRARTGRWILHTHLLCLDADDESMEALRAIQDCLGDRSLMIQREGNVARQVSYLQKFATYHRPTSTSTRRGRAVPLPRLELRELVEWFDRHTFADFEFLFRARRAGDHIRPLYRKRTRDPP